jgi:small-conductance mechanosensitive channel
MQVEMLMEHYRYVYELYDELMKGKAPEVPKEPGKPKIDQERRELIEASTAIRKTQISSLVDDFSRSINNLIDKIVDERIRHGLD